MLILQVACYAALHTSRLRAVLLFVPTNSWSLVAGGHSVYVKNIHIKKYFYVHTCWFVPGTYVLLVGIIIPKVRRKHTHVRTW